MRDIIKLLESLNVEVNEAYGGEDAAESYLAYIDELVAKLDDKKIAYEIMNATDDIRKALDMEPTNARMNIESIVKEGLGELAHEAEKDHEVQMARSDLYKIAKYAVAIHKMLKDRSEMDGLEGWVQSKITKSADYMGAVKHYMEGEIMADVELAVVPVAGDMTDAMTMPQESIEEVHEAEERTYIVVHAKHGKEEIKASSSYAAAKKYAEMKKLKSTAGVDAHLADEKKTATESVEVTEDRQIMVRATNIDYAGPALDKLPTEITLKLNIPWRPYDTEDEIYDMVADELEDRYGVKISGFDMNFAESIEEEDVIGDIIGKLEKMGIKGKTPQKPKTSSVPLPKPKPAEPIGSDLETGATRGLPPEEVYSPQQLQQIANQNRITKPALKKESKFANWSKK